MDTDPLRRPRKLRRRLNATVLLSIVWFAAFGLETAGIVYWSSALQAATERLAAAGGRLNLAAVEASTLIGRAAAASADAMFLKGLPDLLPQDKGYLRTQKAIAEEVQERRSQLSRKLEGALYIVVDAKTNKLYLKKGFKLLWEADCSVGKGGMLVDKRTGRRWEFVTPRGEFRVVSKAENPEWKKPDWAYAETGEKPPPPDDPSRFVKGELGAYLLNLGNGYLIHGTKNEALLGRPASHGCVRLGADDLKRLYQKAPVGTRVFILY